MGTFWGSINIYTSELEQVINILESVTFEYQNKQKGCKFYVSAPKNGWIRIFPSGRGQDAAISQAIAKKFSADIIHCYVHDDDLFCYFYYKYNQLLDEYWSIPDYFDGVLRRKTTEEEENRLRGNPLILSHLFQSGTSIDHVKLILQHSSIDDAVNRGIRQMEEFSQILGIPDIMFSYENIETFYEDKEREILKELEPLRHIPSR